MKKYIIPILAIFLSTSFSINAQPLTSEENKFVNYGNRLLDNDPYYDRDYSSRYDDYYRRYYDRKYDDFYYNDQYYFDDTYYKNGDKHYFEIDKYYRNGKKYFDIRDYYFRNGRKVYSVKVDNEVLTKRELEDKIEDYLDRSIFNIDDFFYEYKRIGRFNYDDYYYDNDDDYYFYKYDDRTFHYEDSVNSYSRRYFLDVFIECRGNDRYYTIKYYYFDDKGKKIYDINIDDELLTRNQVYEYLHPYFNSYGRYTIDDFCPLGYGSRYKNLRNKRFYYDYYIDEDGNKNYYNDLNKDFEKVTEGGRTVYKKEFTYKGEDDFKHYVKLSYYYHNGRKVYSIQDYYKDVNDNKHYILDRKDIDEYVYTVDIYNEDNYKKLNLDGKETYVLEDTYTKNNKKHYVLIEYYYSDEEKKDEKIYTIKDYVLKDGKTDFFVNVDNKKLTTFELEDLLDDYLNEISYHGKYNDKDYYYDRNHRRIYYSNRDYYYDRNGERVYYDDYYYYDYRGRRLIRMRPKYFYDYFRYDYGNYFEKVDDISRVSNYSKDNNQKSTKELQNEFKSYLNERNKKIESERN